MGNLNNLLRGSLIAVTAACATVPVAPRIENNACFSCLDESKTRVLTALGATGEGIQSDGVTTVKCIQGLSDADFPDDSKGMEEALIAGRECFEQVSVTCAGEIAARLNIWGLKDILGG